MQKPITVDGSHLPVLAWAGARYIAVIVGTLEAAKHAVEPSLVEPSIGVAAVAITACWALYREARRHSILVRLADALPDSLAVVKRSGYDGRVNPITGLTTQPEGTTTMSEPAVAGGSALSAASAAALAAASAQPATSTPVTTSGADLTGHADAVSAAVPAVLATTATATGLPATHPSFWLYAAKLLDVVSAALAPAYQVSRASDRTQLAVSLGVGLADSAAHALAGQ